jgi:uncharacterized protein YkwD
VTTTEKEALPMGRHRRRRGHARAGLLSASAALTVGAVAVGTGLLPGMGSHPAVDETGAGDAVARGSASTSPSASPSPTLERDDPLPETGRDREREAVPEETDEPAGDPTGTPGTGESSSPAETATPSPTEQETGQAEEGGTAGDTAGPSAGTGGTSPEPDPTTEEPSADPAPEEPADDPAATAAQAVLALVNEERALAGCRPLTADPALGRLAADFSRDMAERGFFDHTDPDGATPWDRAERAGVTYLGGENIARGQADAQAVMDAWMNSEGHRANILNCEFTTLGVGVYLGDGGPWWTQEFGY